MKTILEKIDAAVESTGRANRETVTVLVWRHTDDMPWSFDVVGTADRTVYCVAKNESRADSQGCEEFYHDRGEAYNAAHDRNMNSREWNPTREPVRVYERTIWSEKDEMTSALDGGYHTTEVEIPWMFPGTGSDRLAYIEDAAKAELIAVGDLSADDFE